MVSRTYLANTKVIRVEKAVIEVNNPCAVTLVCLSQDRSSSLFSLRPGVKHILETLDYVCVHIVEDIEACVTCIESTEGFYFGRTSGSKCC